MIEVIGFLKVHSTISSVPWKLISLVTVLLRFYLRKSTVPLKNNIQTKINDCFMRGKNIIYIARNVTHRHARDVEKNMYMYICNLQVCFATIILDNESEVKVL